MSWFSLLTEVCLDRLGWSAGMQNRNLQ